MDSRPEIKHRQRRQCIAVAQLPYPLGNSGPDVFAKVIGICQSTVA